ncbi:MAG TPA: hypothetical protein VGL56_12050 [Fimbriimonadaceae bacterium]
MSTDLPAGLENLKEEGSEPIYNPPYEAEQGLEPTKPKPMGEEIDYTESEEVRDTGLPDVRDLERPVDLEDPPVLGNELNGYDDGGKGIEMGHGTVGAEEFRGE